MLNISIYVSIELIECIKGSERMKPEIHDWQVRIRRILLLLWPDWRNQQIIVFLKWGRYYAEINNTWWCHDMKKLTTLLALCEVNSPVTGGFLTQRSGFVEFDVFLSYPKQAVGERSSFRWFETPLDHPIDVGFLSILFNAPDVQMSYSDLDEMANTRII